VEKPSSKKSARMKRLYEDPAARRKTGEATSIGRKRQRRSQ
jgi:ribosomal protein S21